MRFTHHNFGDYQQEMAGYTHRYMWRCVYGNGSRWNSLVSYDAYCLTRPL